MRGKRCCDMLIPKAKSGITGKGGYKLAVPVFVSTDDAEFGVALTKLALGASVPQGFNVFDRILGDFILGYNNCDIFREGTDKESVKNMLLSLNATSADQEKLIAAYPALL